MNLLRKNLKSVFSDVKLNIQSIYQGHHKVTYRGVPSIKCPFDYVIYQMIIMQVQPDLIIEIGTNRGGSALYFADLLNILEKGEVHTIDLNLPDPLVTKHPRIKSFTGGWQNYNLDQAKQFSKILVIDDASHLYQETLLTMNKFAPLVSIDSYLIVEDGIIDELGMSKQYFGGPLKAINEFMAINHDFIIDDQWCNFFGKNTTFNINGYLKRVTK